MSDNDLESTVQLVRDCGLSLSTGHADTHEELMREVLFQLEEFRRAAVDAKWHYMRELECEACEGFGYIPRVGLLEGFDGCEACDGTGTLPPERPEVGDTVLVVRKAFGAVFGTVHYVSNSGWSINTNPPDAFRASPFDLDVGQVHAWKNDEWPEG